MSFEVILIRHILNRYFKTFFVLRYVGMCTIEYTPSEVQAGMEAFDLGAVMAGANIATAQVLFSTKFMFINWELISLIQLLSM